LEFRIRQRRPSFFILPQVVFCALGRSYLVNGKRFRKIK
jgi:hypothetical protein